MKYLNLCLLLLLSNLILAQSEEALIAEIQAYQEEENAKFRNPETSILLPADRETFAALDYYEIDTSFIVEARFIRTPDEQPFLMKTTTARLPEYVKYGEAHFEIDGKAFKLALFQSTSHESEEGYEDYLFLPFTDLTSGDGSYGGGRFIDCWIPEGETIVIDFNRSYNPYCAYNPRYSCPIPPKENDLQIRIEAGVKDFGHH